MLTPHELGDCVYDNAASYGDMRVIYTHTASDDEAYGSLVGTALSVRSPVDLFA